MRLMVTVTRTAIVMTNSCDVCFVRWETTGKCLDCLPLGDISMITTAVSALFILLNI